jgi:hypothetical protein
VQRSSLSQALTAGRHTRELPSRVQVPLADAPFATEHASQAPAQAVSQHTPSEQKFERHSFAALHGAPRAFFAAQYWPLHQVFAGQPLAQGMGQSGRLPLHTTVPPHAGLPGSFAGAGWQVPSLPGRLQRSQLPVHAVLQHTPSAQKPELHSGLDWQLAPSGLSGTHTPFALQYRPGAHCR